MKMQCKRSFWITPVLAIGLFACASSSSLQKVAPEIDPRDPLAPTLLMQQGEALVAQGKPDAGIEKYRAALRLQPTNPTVHNLLGVAELQRGAAAKALESFNRALSLAPSYSDARNNRGAAYVQLGQTSLAETDFLSVLGDNLYANRAGVYFNLGALYFSKGNLAAAEENLRRAATANGPVDAAVMLGQVEDQLGKTELAENAYRDAISRAPERPEIALAFGRFLDRLGRTDEARELYRRVMSLSPGSPEAEQARTLLGR